MKSLVYPFAPTVIARNVVTKQSPPVLVPLTLSLSKGDLTSFRRKLESSTPPLSAVIFFHPHRHLLIRGLFLRFSLYTF